MNGTAIELDQAEEDILTREVADAALETASLRSSLLFAEVGLFGSSD